MKLFSATIALGLLLGNGAVALAGPKTAPSEAVQGDHLAEIGTGLVRFINGEAKPEGVFSAAFLAQRSPEHMEGLAKKLRGSLGRAVGVGAIKAETANMGTILINFENRQLPFKVALDPSTHLLVGLAISG